MATTKNKKRNQKPLPEKKEIRNESHYAFVFDTRDHEGLDEWTCHIFDENGNHADPLFEREPCSFSTCVKDASRFISENPNLQLRVVFGRVM